MLYNRHQVKLKKDRYHESDTDYQETKNEMVQLGFPLIWEMNPFHYHDLMTKLRHFKEKGYTEQVIPDTPEDCLEVIDNLLDTATVSIEHQAWCKKIDGEDDVDGLKKARFHHNEMVFLMERYRNRLLEERMIATLNKVLTDIEKLKDEQSRIMEYVQR